MGRRLTRFLSGCLVLGVGLGIGLVVSSAQVRYVSRASAGTETILPSTFQARMTTESGVAVSSSDRAAQSTLYLTPYEGDQIALYDGADWAYFTVANESLDISSCTTVTPYDVFAVDTSGVTLEHVAWTNDTTRATAINKTQDGIWTKTGDATRRYVGTYYCNASGQTDDTDNIRYVWNHYNRMARRLNRDRADNTTWTSGTGTRQAGALTANRAQVVVGQPDAYVQATYNVFMYAPAAASWTAGEIGVDSTSDEVSGSVNARLVRSADYGRHSSQYSDTPGIGQHDFNLLEYILGTGSTTWYGTDGGQQSGLVGWVGG
jgi:hypothetical protein